MGIAGLSELVVRSALIKRERESESDEKAVTDELRLTNLARCKELRQTVHRDTLPIGIRDSKSTHTPDSPGYT